ncbi:MAG TPA: hypothetical protein VFZ51_00155, partial [Woeseiaceae bacterium]
MTELILLALLALSVVGLAWFWLNRRRMARRLAQLNMELVAAAGDASVGRRLSVADSGDIG